MTFAQYIGRTLPDGRGSVRSVGRRKRLPHLVLLALASAALLCAQTANTCSWGANPPGPPPNREQHPYANAPEDMRPFSKFTVPYYENYGSLVQYNGAARDVPTVKPTEVNEVRIGFQIGRASSRESG